MRSWRRWLLAGAAAWALGGCIEAQLPDGTLLCNPDPARQCPRGYFCAGNGFCYHDGHTVPPARDMAQPADLADAGSD